MARDTTIEIGAINGFYQPLCLMQLDLTGHLPDLAEKIVKPSHLGAY